MDSDVSDALRVSIGGGIYFSHLILSLKHFLLVYYCNGDDTHLCVHV